MADIYLYAINAGSGVVLHDPTSIPQPPPDPDPDPDPEVPDERNYTWLQAEVVDWLHRPDLAPKVPKFITMAEARINRIVQARGMEIEAARSVGAGLGAVGGPAGVARHGWLATPGAATSLA
jgi:hypothetical protein